MSAYDDIVTALEKIRDAGELNHALQPVYEDYGLDSVVLAPIMNPYHSDFIRQVYLDNIQHWFSEWLDKHYFIDDPVFARAIASHEPFYFHEVWQSPDLTRPQRKVIENTKHHDVADGFLVRKDNFLFSTSSAQELNFSPEQECKLVGIAKAAIAGWQKTLTATEPTMEEALTSGEKRAIWWAAVKMEEGFVDADVRKELGISPVTLKNQITSASHKLGVSGKGPTILRALRDKILP
ncbi:MAG: autoinducer binding domain-containing protein [bacterium]